MILTVTPDPVLDNILLIEKWTQDIPMKAIGHHRSVGGKGLDSSVALTHLGGCGWAFCFLAGRTGQELLDLICEEYGFPVSPVWVQGDTRAAHIIADTGAKTHNHIFTGGINLTPENEHILITQFVEKLPLASFVITGGIFPDSASPDLHAKIIQEANSQGIPTLIDAHTRFMRSALKYRPTIVKQNQHEFCDTFNQNCRSVSDLVTAGRNISVENNIQNLVITCGKSGILAFTEQGDFHVLPPILEPINAAGAGDAASAALAWQLSETRNWQTALHWAVAVSAAVVLTEGTADFHLNDVERILKDVEIKRI